MKFTTKQRSDGQWYWTGTARNGNITGHASGYNTRSGARKAARNFVKAVKKLPEIIEVD